jgi:two-component system chemotaxis response regulator CheY
MNKIIMTVDDSPSIRQMDGYTLTQHGHSVIEACDGRDALAKLSHQPVHLIITDLNMPNMNGIELIQQARALPQCRFIPILMLTTESQPEKKQAGRAAGATGWIVKPFTREQLTAVVDKVLR